MLRNKVILLAEDEVMVRNFIRTVLQTAGYDVLAAADGNEALELSRAHDGRIDLLLTDVQMLQMDGILLYRQISTDRRGTKVLFISGRTFAQELPEAWPFLRKPVQADTLCTKVEEILDEARCSKTGVEKVILVVDHNAERQERTKKILTENGYGVLTASSVEEAEAVSDSTISIDLIITGVVFPGHSGVHLAEHVDVSERKINSLLISHFHPDLLHNVPGFSRQPEFLPNPFTPEVLLTHVRRLLENRR